MDGQPCPVLQRLELGESYVEAIADREEAWRHEHVPALQRRPLEPGEIDRDALPSLDCVPKTLHRHAAVASISESNAQGRHPARLLSFQGVSLAQFARCPEAAAAKRIVVVVRDVANTMASIKREEQALQRESFLHPTFQGLTEGVKEYLHEACGHTHALAAQRSKTVFVSYNRWHTDLVYRRQIAAALGIKPGAGASQHDFAGEKNGASAAANHQRWRQSSADRRFWNLVCAPAMHALERSFHGRAMASYGELAG